MSKILHLEFVNGVNIHIEKTLSTPKGFKKRKTCNFFL